MARQRNNKVLVCEAMISAGENYGTGIGEIVNRRTTYLGASTTKTFFRTIEPVADSMLANIQIYLFSVNKTVLKFDNNQLEYPLNYQRFESSILFCKGNTTKMI